MGPLSHAPLPATPVRHGTLTGGSRTWSAQRSDTRAQRDEERQPVDFDHSPKAQDYIGRMRDFLDTRILPAEEEYEAYRNEKGREDHTLPPVVEELKVEARE